MNFPPKSFSKETLSQQKQKGMSLACTSTIFPQYNLAPIKYHGKEKVFRQEHPVLLRPRRGRHRRRGDQVRERHAIARRKREEGGQSGGRYSR